MSGCNWARAVHGAAKLSPFICILWTPTCKNCKLAARSGPSASAASPLQAAISSISSSAPSTGLLHRPSSVKPTSRERASERLMDCTNSAAIRNTIILSQQFIWQAATIKKVIASSFQDL